MMKLAVALCAVLVLQVEGTSPGRFSGCFKDYYLTKKADGEKPTCDTIAALGRCLATYGVSELPATDSVRISAETVLLAAQQENVECASQDDHSVAGAAQVRVQREQNKLEFAVNEKKDVNVFRMRRETVSLYELSASTVTNKKDIAAMKASVADDIKLLTDDVRVTNDTMVNDVAALVKELKDDAEANKQETLDIIAEMQANFTKFADQLIGDTAKQIESANKLADDEIGKMPKPYKMTPFIRWGKRSCPDGTIKFYDGVHFNGHQGHGGGSDHVCIENADRGKIGGRHIGSSSHDLMYPGSVNHDAGLVPRDTIIPCAQCMAETSCMEVRGQKTCPKNYEFVYHGYLFGNRYHDRLSGDRFCIDKTFQRSEGYGGYRDSWLYATRIQNTPGGSAIQRYDSIECGVCCYKGE